MPECIYRLMHLRLRTNKEVEHWQLELQVNRERSRLSQVNPHEWTCHSQNCTGLESDTLTASILVF